MSCVFHDTHEKFEHATELKTKLVASFEDKLPPLSGLEYDYLLRGGLKMIRISKPCTSCLPQVAFFFIERYKGVKQRYEAVFFDFSFLIL